MDPVHTIEYELTSEMATAFQQAMMRFGLRAGWRRDWPVYLWGLALAMLIAWPVLAGWISPGVGGACLFLVALFVVGSVFRRRMGTYTAATTALLGLHTTDRRVRVEFHDERVRMETEYWRGEGAWTELEEIVVFPDFWALGFTNGGQILVPGTLLTPELSAFVRSRAEQVAAPVVQG